MALHEMTKEVVCACVSREPPLLRQGPGRLHHALLSSGKAPPPPRPVNVTWK